jgi:hypothetical protein
LGLSKSPTRRRFTSDEESHSREKLMQLHLADTGAKLLLVPTADIGSDFYNIQHIWYFCQIWAHLQFPVFNDFGAITGVQTDSLPLRILGTFCVMMCHGGRPVTRFRSFSRNATSFHHHTCRKKEFAARTMKPITTTSPTVARACT